MIPFLFSFDNVWILEIQVKSKTDQDMNQKSAIKYYY
jgi:hypothetical protein